MAGGLVISALTGYAFAKFEFRGKKFLFAVIVATCYSGTVGFDRVCIGNEVAGIE